MNFNNYSKLIRPSDLHCWVEHRDGTIHEPHFKYYMKIKKHCNIPRKNKPVYQQFVGNKLKAAYKYVYVFFLRQIDIGIDKHDYVKKPKNNECWFNAWKYYKEKPSERLFRIGKMGWKQRNGEIYWQFGDTHYWNDYWYRPETQKIMKKAIKNRKQEKIEWYGKETKNKVMKIPFYHPS